MSDSVPSSREVLLVPMHVDALCVDGLDEMAAPGADFSRLPHVHAGQDINAEVPWLGEAIAARPFENSRQKLGRGVHLHWVLPGALCRAAALGEVSTKSALSFPAVPDRWLVIKRWLDGDARRVERWIVESNYLHPSGAVPERPAVSYPFPTNLELEPGARPYRYLGRVVPLARWRDGKREGDAYLPEPLTALGYGVPNFSTFYPNCHSVFGFHDETVALANLTADLSYEVLGWYDDPARDHLRTLLARSQRPCAELIASLGWQLDRDAKPDAATLLVCQGKVTFAKAADTRVHAGRTVEVTFGNTTSEALSAYLASIVEPNSAQEAEVEDQLEAVLLAAKLDALESDVAAKFREARHAKGFASAPPAFVWTLRPALKKAPEGSAWNAPTDELAEQAKWPAGAAALLETLNALQHEYNAAHDQIRHLRRQVASDWHKYMLCAHPPEGIDSECPNADSVRRFIEQHGLPELETLVAATGTLEIFEVAGAPLGANNDVRASGARDSLAQRIVDQAKLLHGRLVPPALSAPTPGPPGSVIPWAPILPRFFLQRVVAPRYYQPTEPVILLTGDGVNPKTRHRFDRLAGAHEADGLLPCFYLKLDHELTVSLEALEDALSQHNKWELHDGSNPPWHPMLMDWEVELRPLAYATQRSLDRTYDPEAVVRTFTLERTDSELTPRSEVPALARRARVYRGSSLLTPHGVDPYIGALERELKRDRALALDDSTRKRLQQALTWLTENHALAQSLSGFNDALLMNRQGLQLPIDDPLGFPNERAVAARVRAALGTGVHRSPQPRHGFSPIRTGELRLSRLRLLDNFGRALVVDCNTVRCRSARTLPLRRGAAIMLPPRFAQPARLHFRWRAAATPVHETNPHPSSTPICGWLMANHADGNAFVYASDGEALGYLEVDGLRPRWRSAPGRTAATGRVDQDIVDSALRRLVRFFLGCSGRYFNQFLADLEAAQDRIEPDDPGEGLLMGRPLALVRASLQLQLQGPPAIHQGWHQLLGDMQGGPRRTDGFTAVRFPARLGEQDQLGDGLAVYFLEDAAGAYDAYVIPTYKDAGDPALDAASRKCDFVYLSVDSPALMVTMLVDPRGVVHATTGVLPTKSIGIPPEHYRAAVRRLEMSFLAAPLLMDRLADGADRPENNEVTLPISVESEQAWSFLEKRNQVFQAPRAARSGSLHTPFSAPVAISEGWLRLTRTLPKP
jgi:hypothetical protein